jgi:hypothetical protein
MGGGVIVSSHGKDYPGSLTFKVLLTCIVASMGGLIFGYDLGISGNNTLLFISLIFIYLIFFFFLGRNWGLRSLGIPLKFDIFKNFSRPSHLRV